MTHPLPCWLDCDVGHDDAFALMLAAYHPSINLMGISTCSGNQSIDKTTSNTLKFMYMAGLDTSIDQSINHTTDIPVVIGRHEPLSKPAIVASTIHGETGLDGFSMADIQPTNQPINGKVADVMYNAIESYMRSHNRLPENWDSMKQSINQPFTTPDSEFGHASGVTIIATGPLTNVALLLLVYPEVKHLLRSITIMGGAIGGGNISASAEFNIFVDDVAARIVFNSGVHVVMTPLELTHTALATPDIIQSIRSLQSPFADSLCGFLEFFASTYKEVMGLDAPPLHDPCAVAYLIIPSIFKSVTTHVDIETEGLSGGRTVCDMLKVTKLRKNATVLTSMDVNAFWQLIIESIKQANAHSPLNTK